MKINFALGMFMSGLGTIVLGNTATPDQIVGQAYAYKDLTVSGLLMIAVIVLYRELRAAQKQQTDLVQQNQRFMETQSAAIKKAADDQGAALGEVVSVLQQVQEATARQVQLYDETISKLVDKQVGK
jgi:hypothetical protein